MSLWDEVSRRSSKYKHGDCAQKWSSFKRRDEGEPEVTIRSLRYWAEHGHTDRYNQIIPTLNMNKHVFSDDAEYPAIEIDTPFLTPEPRPHQKHQTRRPSRD